MKSTINTKRATLTIIDRLPINAKNDRVAVRRLAEYKVALDAATKNKENHLMILYKAEVQKQREILRRPRDQKYIFNVVLKKPYKYAQKVEIVFDYNDKNRDYWKTFLKQAEDVAIQGARRGLNHVQEHPHKLWHMFTVRHGSKDKGFTYFTEGNVLKAHIKKNIKGLYDSKAPEALRRYIGIELEFCAPIREENFAIKLFQAGIHKFAQLKQDGSLRPRDKETGYELAILLEETNFKRGLKTITDVLKSVKAVAKDRRCGLHVHVDMRRRDKELVYNNLVACQYALLSVVDPIRYNNEFCRVVDTRKFPTEFTGDRHERYKTINAAAYYKYKTLEVRMHEGSVDFTEISNWVNLVVKITNYSKRLKDDVTKLPLLQRRMKLNKKLYDYALERSCTWQVQNTDHMQHLRQDIGEQEVRRVPARTTPIPPRLHDLFADLNIPTAVQTTTTTTATVPGIAPITFTGINTGTFTTANNDRTWVIPGEERQVIRALAQEMVAQQADELLDFPPDIHDTEDQE